MVGLIAPIAVASLAAFALGGSPRGWSHQRVRWTPLAIVALLIQAALFAPPLDEQAWVIAAGRWLWVGTMVAVLSMLARNMWATRRALRMAWAVAATGVVANLSVVVANGGLMPRSVPLGDAPDAAAPHEFSNVYLVQHDAPLLWLGDVIAQPDWLPIANAVSIGDLLLSTGLAGWAFVAALEARRRTV